MVRNNYMNKKIYYAKVATNMNELQDMCNDMYSEGYELVTFTVIAKSQPNRPGERWYDAIFKLRDS